MKNGFESRQGDRKEEKGRRMAYDAKKVVYGEGLR